MSIYQKVLTAKEDTPKTLPEPLPAPPYKPLLKIRWMLIGITLGVAAMAFAPFLLYQASDQEKKPATNFSKLGNVKIKAATVSKLAVLQDVAAGDTDELALLILDSEYRFKDSKIKVWSAPKNTILVCANLKSGARFAKMSAGCELWHPKTGELEERVLPKDVYHSQLLAAAKMAVAQPGDELVVTSLSGL